MTFTFAFVSVAVQRYTSVQSSKDLAQEAPKDVPKPPLEAPAEAAGSEPTDASLEPRRAA